MPFIFFLPRNRNVAASLVGMLTAVWILAFQHLPKSRAFFFTPQVTPLFEANYNIHKLTDESYEVATNHTEYLWIVDFYAPWCPHCQQFAPDYEAVANHYANQQKTPIQFGSVDCTKQHKVCSMENIYGYPTVKAFNVQNRSSVHSGKTQMNRFIRSCDKIIEWIDSLLDKTQLRADEKESASTIIIPTNARVIPNENREKYVQNKEMKMLQRLNRLRDAAGAMMFSFEYAFFLGTTVLEGERYLAASKWLDILKGSFPLECNRLAIADLVSVFVKKSTWPKKDWHEALEEWTARVSMRTFPLHVFSRDIQWSSCDTYTCGLWTLFHMLTVSIIPGTETEAGNVADAIRDFVQYFFGCKECVKHFLRANPPHVISEIGAGSDSPSKVILWMWKMHNIVNKVLKRSVWPNRFECGICYSLSGEDELDNTTVISFMRHTYFVPEEDKSAEKEANLERKLSRMNVDPMADEPWGIYSSSLATLTWYSVAALLCCFTVLILFTAVGRRRLRGRFFGTHTHIA